MSELNDIEYDYSDRKIFKDSVHGIIEIETLFVKIIDTPEFQRLRNIKQLETISYVYPSAVHTRFEHSIGTAYLARMFIDHIKKSQPELNISLKDSICVQMAGLCHDIGHGPFSHLFEEVIKKVYISKNPNASKSEVSKFFVHETASLLIFERIFNRLKHDELFKKVNLNDQDKEFVKQMIKPTIIEDINDLYKELKANETESVKIIKKIKEKENDLYEKCGRKIDKSFLFEIISNFRNQIDVDKWDYFARDSLNVGIKNTFDYGRFMCSTRVLNPDNTLNQICVRDNELRNVYEFFKTREDLYRRVYQHSKCVGIKQLVIDAIFELNSVFDFYKIVSDLENNLDSYLELDDRILFLNTNIASNLMGLNNTKANSFKKSRDLIKRLLDRKLYKIVSKKFVSKNSSITKQLIEKLIESNLTLKEHLSPEDIGLVDIKVNFGNGDRDPLEKISFYEKKTFKIIDKEKIPDFQSKMKPQIFEEISWILLLKKKFDNKEQENNIISNLKNSFDLLC